MAEQTGTNISCAKNVAGLLVATSLADAVARFRSLAYTQSAQYNVFLPKIVVRGLVQLALRKKLVCTMQLNLCISC